ncbi:MAG: aminopeptidase P family protein [Pseudonocardia sp.]|nr:aminopeptidase P family protein [Pseudonocardia sp.]
MTTTRPATEDVRAQRLVEAEQKAIRLFAEVTRRGLIEPGLTEKQVSDRVRDLGAELFGTDKHWHKRIVRSGPNTLAPYAENPPDRAIEADDIVFLDFGPIFSAWEADVGRTYVLGADPVKARLRDDLPRIFDAGKQHYRAHPEISGEQLYRHVCGLAADAGWEFGGAHSGHLVGEFPHERIDSGKITSYITPGSTHPMRRTDPSGRRCHWILEIHLVDRERGIGGFFEQLLTLDS